MLLLVYPLTIYRFTAAHVPSTLLHIPVDKAHFAAMAGHLDGMFEQLYRLGSGSFDSMRDGIRLLVGAFETLLVDTPWPVVMTVARPILDLMQTMPSMVYLIPAIAFFGTGTAPDISATLIFGLPPVVRLTARRQSRDPLAGFTADGTARSVAERACDSQIS